MIKTKFAKLTKIDSDSSFDELGRFPAENHKLFDDNFLLEQKNELYKDSLDDWSSLEMSNVATELIKYYFKQKSTILEIGCGIGADSEVLYNEGYSITGIDKSKEAIFQARKNSSASFIIGDFIETNFENSFGNIYEKGVFHNLISDSQRIEFVKKIASNLKSDGVWLNISGCADSKDIGNRFGRIYFNELISIAENYFKVIEVRRSSYGKIKGNYDFEAWFTIFQKR